MAGRQTPPMYAAVVSARSAGKTSWSSSIRDRSRGWRATVSATSIPAMALACNFPTLCTAKMMLCQRWRALGPWSPCKSSAKPPLPAAVSATSERGP